MIDPNARDAQSEVVSGAVKVSYANSTAPNKPFTPTPSEGQQPVAWGEFYGGKIVAVSLHKSHHYTVPLYTRPSEQAVTEALKAALETMNRYRRAGHGDDVFMDDLCRSIRKAESALKAAMEAGR